ncbi:VOC family protein [Nocardioides daeguensis]|uniref:Glyoxalase-like domain-containing protein n=1 Tax=Nocardioides daeguensis TaxID=908359 RepID=A0ABP6VGE9_9ACTN|nr:VOC family protein [Nocardioides daeguensis]MBV6729515.1 VOC family protein [Nocardioides daeguensis]MCR1771712.1 VOC family protein [Nocardioides daeguensis]
MHPFWITAFLDSAPEHHQETVGFWQEATGYAVSPPRGAHDEFASLLPPDGGPYLKVQRRHAGADRIHLDLHVTDPLAAADAARVAGATIVADRGYVVMASPAGFVFCLVDHAASRVPAATVHAHGSASRVVQVAIDVPRAAYDRELAFWHAVTRWEQRPSSVTEDFTFLFPPAGQPLRLMLQRLGADDTGEVRAHLDWGTTDRAAETERHLELGSRVLAQHQHWTVLADPNGRAYCLTDAAP